ncbi:N-acetylmuramoyl-L-alanine amidase [Priestia megaterium]
MATINNYLPKSAQTGISLGRVRGIIVHWVANPNTTAAANISYWRNQSNGIQAHDVINLNGDLYHAVPYNVMCYHIGSKVYTKDCLKRLGSYPNNATIGVECTHVDWDGKMTDATYQTLVTHVANLCKKFGLTADDVWLHYETNGWKDCHRYFVKSLNGRWKTFLRQVADKIAGSTGIVTAPSRPSTANDDVHMVEDLGIGDSGTAVQNLQKDLTALGYDTQGTDGKFGKNTQAAVLKFQKDHGLVADGIAGLNTKAEIEKALNKKEGKTIWYRVRRDPNDAKTQLTAVRDKDSALAFAKKENAYVLEDTKVIYTPSSGPKLPTPKPTPTPSKPTTFVLPNVVMTRTTKNDKEQVKQVQRALNALYFKCGAVDGIYGAGTADAVLRYQTMYGNLKDDGKYGPATRAQMLVDLAGK